MEVVYECCCGLDVHAKTVVACLIKRGRKEIRTFSTMTAELLQLADWLTSAGCMHVAIESTGGYWKPVFNILEAVLTVILVNARHIKAVPGRKTDVRDCEWLADLLRHGLLKASFIPPLEIRELREFTRYRQTLVTEHTAVANRLQKLLEGANIKLGQVASDVLGLSGRLMLRALAEGERDAEKLAELAQGKLKSKQGELRRALEGRLTQAQRWVLTELLARLDELEAALTRVETRIGEEVNTNPNPFVKAAVELLDSIPGGGSGPPKQSSPKSASIWAAFPPRSTWQVGRGCVRAITSRRASVRVGRPPRGARPCARPWWKPLGPQPAPRGHTCG
jgi:hypothetical protein